MRHYGVQCSSFLPSIDVIRDHVTGLTTQYELSINTTLVHASAITRHSLRDVNTDNNTSVSLWSALYILSVNLSDFTVWLRTWRKNWVNCAVLTGSVASLRTAVSSRLSRRELLGSLRKSYSFVGLPADTTMASSQGTSVSSNSFSRWASHDIFLFKYHFLLHILCFLFFFLGNIMADVASKQQTTALFLSTTVTHTRRHTELTNLMGYLCCAREHSVQFFVQFFLHSLT